MSVPLLARVVLGGINDSQAAVVLIRIIFIAAAPEVVSSSKAYYEPPFRRVSSSTIFVSAEVEVGGPAPRRGGVSSIYTLLRPPSAHLKGASMSQQMHIMLLPQWPPRPCAVCPAHRRRHEQGVDLFPTLLPGPIKVAEPHSSTVVALALAPLHQHVHVPRIAVNVPGARRAQSVRILPAGDGGTDLASLRQASSSGPAHGRRRCGASPEGRSVRRGGSGCEDRVASQPSRPTPAAQAAP